MTRNVELLQKVMDYIEAHPEKHDQTDWFCGTAACFAGHAALMSGWTIVTSQKNAGMVTNGDCIRYVPGVARDALGLTIAEADALFDESLTTPQLHVMVDDLILKEV